VALTLGAILVQVYYSFVEPCFDLQWADVVALVIFPVAMGSAWLCMLVRLAGRSRVDMVLCLAVASANLVLLGDVAFDYLNGFIGAPSTLRSPPSADLGLHADPALATPARKPRDRTTRQ